MAFFKKSSSVIIDAAECEHILGVLLTDRKQFISFSGISQDNIYAGMVIGRAFNVSIEKLDDEFDALAIFYTWKILYELGASESQFIRGATAVFDNFDIGQQLREIYSLRIKEYTNLDSAGLGVRLLANIASIYDGKLEKNDPKVLASQLNEFYKLLRVNIKRELAA